MILSEKKAIARLSSPDNLMNRLNSLSRKSPRSGAMSLFVPSARKIESPATPIPTKKEEAFNPFANKTLVPVAVEIAEAAPTLDTLISNGDQQVELALAHDRALHVLNKSLNALSAKIDDVKAERLPSVVSAASKVVTDIRRERLEAAKATVGKDREVHYHFYTPQQKSIADYKIIDVGATAPQVQGEA